MSLQPQINDDSYTEIILSSIKSSNFWSITLGSAGIFAVIFGGSINLAFEGLKDLSLWEQGISYQVVGEVTAHQAKDG